MNDVWWCLPYELRMTTGDDPHFEAYFEGSNPCYRPVETVRFP